MEQDHEASQRHSGTEQQILSWKSKRNCRNRETRKFFQGTRNSKLVFYKT